MLQESIDTWLHQLYDTDIAIAMRENALLFPWIEGIHVLGLSLVIGSIAVLDLRLIGIGSRERPVGSVLRDVLPVTWSAFAITLVSGLLLFTSNAVNYAHNACFQWKLFLLALIGANTTVFHFFVEPRVAAAPVSNAPPRLARLSGVLSIVMWIGVTALGRWIGFTINAI